MYSTAMSSPNADHEAPIPPLSPLTRGSSPSPSASPSVALLNCPPLGRSFSSTSTLSDVSTPSLASRTSFGSVGSRRRGYVRPQAVAFAESAKNRDSVMSLGSIAHLQYYFARTGVLDGKGGNLAREGPQKSSSGIKVSISDTSNGSESPVLSHMGGD